MKAKDIMIVCTAILVVIGLANVSLASSKPQKSDRIQLGMYEGQVSYDSEKDCYYIEARGARFPFKTTNSIWSMVPYSV